MGKYITLQEVISRTAGKISFDLDDASDENKMQVQLANELIDEAEAEVELALSLRYRVPFVESETGRFKDLPKTTQTVIKTLCRLQAVMKLLDTDFGRGSAVDATEYYKTIESRYKNMVEDRLLAKVKGMEDTNQFLFPPLPGIRMNFGNGCSDDGFRGAIIAINPSGDGEYPSQQINDPSETWYGITGDE